MLSHNILYTTLVLQRYELIPQTFSADTYRSINTAILVHIPLAYALICGSRMPQRVRCCLRVRLWIHYRTQHNARMSCDYVFAVYSYLDIFLQIDIQVPKCIQIGPFWLVPVELILAWAHEYIWYCTYRMDTAIWTNRSLILQCAQRGKLKIC